MDWVETLNCQRVQWNEIVHWATYREPVFCLQPIDPQYLIRMVEQRLMTSDYRGAWMQPEYGCRLSVVGLRHDPQVVEDLTRTIQRELREQGADAVIEDIKYDWNHHYMTVTLSIRTHDLKMVQEYVQFPPDFYQ
jgi:hypothetical protein